MLELRARHAEVDQLRLRRMELRFRLGYVGGGGNARIESPLGQIQVIRVGSHGLFEQLLFGVHAVQLEICLRQRGLQREPHIFNLGKAGLRRFRAGGNAAADASKHVHLIREIRRQVICSAGLPGGGTRNPTRGRRAGRVAAVRHRQTCADDGKQVRAGDPQRIACRAELALGGNQVLVRHADLLFQEVQRRVAVEFPPFAANGLIAGLGLLPLRSRLRLRSRWLRRGLCLRLSLWRRQFLIGAGNGRAGPAIVGANTARRCGNKEHQQNGRAWEGIRTEP
jgi:hypothetical protein